MSQITEENLFRQLQRLNTLTSRKYYYVKDEPMLTDERYCLMDQNDDEEISRWYTVSEMWEAMYSMIRLMLNETDKPRSWELDYDVDKLLRSQSSDLVPKCED